MASQGASENVLEQTVDGFAQRVNDYAQGIANRLGNPLSGVQLTPEEAVARWNFTPLGDTASADAKFFQLTLQGVPPGQALAQVYPMRAGLFAGVDINDSIAKAQQIANWAADQSGVDRPDKPVEASTLPNAILQQVITKAHEAASPVPPAQPMPAPGILPPGAGPVPQPGLPPTSQMPVLAATPVPTAPPVPGAPPAAPGMAPPPPPLGTS